MWKESYRIGIDAIDTQHMKLFLQANRLLKAIEQKAGKEEVARTIAFLKDYVIIHFRDEEAYQESIGYPGFPQHRQAHRSFTNAVLAYEKRLVETDFEPAVVKELAGTLLSWLIYHVTNEDQKIATGGVRTKGDDSLSVVGLLTASVIDTLCRMAGFDPARIRDSDQTGGGFAADLLVTIDLFGDINGTCSFYYSKEFALSLFEHMTMTRLEEVDGLVGSAMAEIANISLGNATIQLSQRGISCDIRPPAVHLGPVSGDGPGIVYNTDWGAVKLSVELDQF